MSVAVENYDFAPASRTITAGDVVRWTFSGDQHSVTSRDGLFDSGIKDPGGSFQFTFTTAGTYRYYCLVHPDLMSGTIVVKAAAATPRPTVRADAETEPEAQPEADRPGRPSSPSPTPTARVGRRRPESELAGALGVGVAGCSAAASLALLETPGPTSVAASPAPGSDGTGRLRSDPTPIVAVGGAARRDRPSAAAFSLARRRRSLEPRAWPARPRSRWVRDPDLLVAARADVDPAVRPIALGVVVGRVVMARPGSSW